MKPYIIAVAGQYRSQRHKKLRADTWKCWLDQAVRLLKDDPSFDEKEFRQLCEARK